MKLEPPLSNLVIRCQTICLAECCGIDAYDFNPIHIASYLLLWRGAADHSEIAKIRTQLDALKMNYGTAGASAFGATFEDMNQGFTASQIDSLVDQIADNLVIALRLIDMSDTERAKRAEPGAPGNAGERGSCRPESQAWRA